MFNPQKVARAAVLAAAILACAHTSSARAFDMDTDNAAADAVIPIAIPKILETIGHGDASLILRITAMTTNAMFDAIAPYHPTAVGVYSRLGRRPASERETYRERNIAVFYSTYRVLSSLLPQHTKTWRQMLIDVGLDPNNDSKDTTTPVGTGNVAGSSIVAARLHDGMNQLGDEGGVKYNRQPYSDYTGYAPVNTAYEVIDAGRWQPNFDTRGNGVFRIQQFVTPQLGVTKPYAIKNPQQFRVPAPRASNPKNMQLYRAQADDVLAQSANLNDYKKAVAEFYDHKFDSLASSGFFAATQAGLSYDEIIQFEFLLNFSAFDGAIVTWKEKYEHDAVRPFTAIQYIYGDSKVTAWGGPGMGTVQDLPASQWRSYTPTADHPEYPSGSSCLCAVHAEVARRFLGTDKLGWSVTRKAGSSFIEPGITPTKDVVLSFKTWTDFENACQDARVWAGVHFRAAVVESNKMCKKLGPPAMSFLSKHIDGTAPAPMLP